jgi:helicase
MKIKIKEPYSDPTLNLVFDTLSQNKQSIIFANTKSSAEKTAEEIAKTIKESNPVYDTISEEALHSLSSPTKQCKRLAYCLKKGIAFHHSGLTQKQRELIEDNFRKKIIKAIIATPTLAMGVDLPAFRVVLKDLKRFGSHGLQYIPVLEYLQMAGRAGRPKFDNTGEAVIVANSDSNKEELTERYINGEPEPILSKLAVEPVLRTYVLSLIATNFVNTKIEIFDFFQETFYAFQYADKRGLEIKIEKMLETLEEWEFIIGSETNEKYSDFRPANELVSKDNKYRATVLGKRVAELYIDPYTAHYFVEILKKAVSKKIRDFSFLQVISSTLEIRPQLRAGTKDHERIQEALLKYGDYLLEEEPSIYEDEYEQFENSIKTTLFFIDWLEEKDEEYILESYNVRPGEIKAKLDIADWLVYCMEEIIRILSFKQLIPELKKLRIRLQYGVKEELIPLLQFKGIGRARSRMLFRNGIKDVGDVKSADIMKLSQILGKNIAIDLKKQVDQDFDKLRVPENKRKGQISLSDYNE